MRFKTMTALQVAGLLALAAGSTGCAWLGGGGLKPPKDAAELQIGERREDWIHCDRGRCTNWYRIVTPKENMRLKIEADAPSSPGLPDFAMELYDREMQLVKADTEAMRRPRTMIEVLKKPGLYYLKVAGLAGIEDRLSYKLSVTSVRAKKPRSHRPTRTTGGTPPPLPLPVAPPPKPRIVDVEVLEVERGADGEPVAVLLEVGTGDGVEPGLRGRLLDRGQRIGRIEIVDVYAEGSRARLVGGLSAPITLDTTAEIER